MHEASVCRDLLERVLEISAREQADAVKSITVQLGVLSGFDAEHVIESFEHVATGTVAEGARIEVELVELQVHCPACDTDSAVTAERLDCPRCQHLETELIDGTELRLARVELTLSGTLQ